MFTKRHYSFIAEVLGQPRYDWSAETYRQRLIDAFTVEFKKDNDRFSERKFRDYVNLVDREIRKEDK